LENFDFKDISLARTLGDAVEYKLSEPLPERWKKLLAKLDAQDTPRAIRAGYRTKKRKAPQAS
jgi:hypothetical protein